MYNITNVFSFYYLIQFKKQILKNSDIETHGF